MIRKSIILAVVPLFLVACGGGGGGSGSGGDVGAGGDGTGINGCGASATPGGSGGVGAGGPSGVFQISGQLNVEESNKVEVECNNSVAGAAAIAPGESYDGQAKSTNAGYKGITARSEAVIHDLYRLDASSENVRVTLSFSDEKTTSNASSPLKSDLDLFLLDSTGKTVVASSEGIDQTVETVTTPGPGVYYIGVRAFEGDSPYLLAAGTTTTTTALDRATVLPGREFVAGDVLVKQKDTTANKAMAATHQLAMVSELGDGVRLMHVAKPANLGIASAATKEKPNAKINAPGHEDNEAIGATLEALLRLKKDSNIAYAEPNFIRHANIVPNDQYYQYQWHYRAINLESAWVDTTRGDGVIVAVIDTGVKSAHPDLAGQLVAGYDFISDSANAGDGNGIDSNPEDVGDGARAGESSFHGTHVAGTIAAASNNGTGVAGIAWNAKIMPLRVLGKRGGTDADIVQAIRYAARLTNSSSTLPAVKADIINMSLGGPSLSNTVQSAVDAARAAGVIIVAAAGNENTNSLHIPRRTTA